MSANNQAIAEALGSIARALRDLGNGNACTEMGAIEAYSIIVKDGAADIAAAIRQLAEAVEGHGS